MMGMVILLSERENGNKGARDKLVTITIDLIDIIRYMARMFKAGYWGMHLLAHSKIQLYRSYLLRGSRMSQSPPSFWLI
jgi:hypothetical protein